MKPQWTASLFVTTFSFAFIHLLSETSQLVSIEKAVTIAPVISKDGSNDESDSMRRSSGSPIPHRLIMTFFKNLLEPEYLLNQEDDGNRARNVRRTIRMYLEAWKTEMMMGNAEQENEIRDKEGDISLNSSVSFLLDNDCIRLINETEPRLLIPFMRERKGSWKADICRVVALWQTGGYYMDTDLIVHEVPILPPSTEFATALEESQVRFHQAFIAVTPKHPVMNLSMQVMIDFYEGRQKALYPANMGTWTMREAYIRWIKEFPEKVESVYFFQERIMTRESSLLPEIERAEGNPWYNHAIVDIPRNKFLFWVRYWSPALRIRYGLTLPLNATNQTLSTS